MVRIILNFVGFQVEQLKHFTLSVKNYYLFIVQHFYFGVGINRIIIFEEDCALVVDMGHKYSEIYHLVNGHEVGIAEGAGGIDYESGGYIPFDLYIVSLPHISY